MALVAKDGSASTLSKRFGDVSLGDVDYHLKVLCNQCRVIELPSFRQVRGAQENFYRLKPWSNFDGDWSEAPRPVVSEFRGALLWRFVDAAIAALRSGAFERRAETTFTTRPVVVDRRGWTETNDALKKAGQEVEGIEAESRHRLKRSGPENAIHVVLGLAAFEAAWPSQGDEQA